MRPVLQSDVTAAARVLLARPQDSWTRFCARLLREADWADRFCRRQGKPHPFWGNGTLHAAAMQYQRAAEPTFDNLAYCSAFEVVLSQLANRKARHHL